MTDLNSRQGRFRGISQEEAARLIKGAVAIINKRASFYSVVMCNAEEMRSVLPKGIGGFENPYSVCCHMAMFGLGQKVRAADPSERIAYFFENGHKHEADANRMIRTLARFSVMSEAYRHFSHAFVSKKEFPPLQTADVLVWECAKYLEESVLQKKRLMRLSLVALLIEGKRGVTSFDSGRFSFQYLTGEPLKRFVRKIEALQDGTYSSGS